MVLSVLFPALSLPSREGCLAGARARALLEGDLAAIEGGTVASFTVGSSPPASPCHAG
jgi:hypothetical protein